MSSVEPRGVGPGTGNVQAYSLMDDATRKLGFVCCSASSVWICGGYSEAVMV